MDTAPTAVELNGMLDADGKLLLDGNPGLPAGRVRVSIQPLSFDPEESEIFQFFKEMHARRGARGERFSTAEEIDADIAELEGMQEEEFQELWNGSLIEDPTTGEGRKA